MIEQVISFPVRPEARKDVIFTEITNRLIAYIREEWLQVNEEALAALLGVNSDLIVEIELGIYAADVAHIFKFSEATGVSVARIMGAVQITEKWITTNQASQIDACFAMNDSRIAFNKLHRLIDTAIREMPQPLRISFDAPLKSSKTKAVAPSVPAAPPAPPPPPPAPPPMKLTPVQVEEEEEPEIVEDSVDDVDLEEAEPESDDEDDEPPPKTKMAPFQPELVEIRPLANYFDGPNFASATKRPEPVVVTTGVKKRGRPRKNPLL